MREPIHAWSSRHVALGELVELGDTVARLSDWAASLNLDARMVRSRIASGDMIVQALRPTKATRASVAVRFDRDPEAIRFVEEHPSGAERAEVGRFFNMSRERVRQIEASAIAKLKLAMDHEPRLRTVAPKTVEELASEGLDADAIMERTGCRRVAVYAAWQAQRRAS